MKTTILTLLILSLLMANGCGKVGAPGPKGDTGATGQNGQDAQPCGVTSVGVSSLAPNGGSLITCPTTSTLVLNGTNGSDGQNGATGATGATGPTGAAGTNGINGTNGTVITMVKLCGGATVYPSKFVEVAACINGSLWGVYSANGGFLTELPAGTYGSNGINSSCNFVIGSNCTVAN